MLDHSQKLYLIKQVDKHALSTERVKALSGYVEKYAPISNEDIKEISDMCYLQETTIRQVIADTCLTMVRSE
jgi:hypothetical protein